MDGRWRTDGVAVIPADALDTNTPQTPGMFRAAAVNGGPYRRRRGCGPARCVVAAGREDRGAPPRRPRERHLRGERPGPHALGRETGVHRRGRPGRLHLRPALRAAPGDQRRAGHRWTASSSAAARTPMVVNLDIERRRGPRDGALGGPDPSRMSEARNHVDHLCRTPRSRPSTVTARATAHTSYIVRPARCSSPVTSSRARLPTKAAVIAPESA